MLGCSLGTGCVFTLSACADPNSSWKMSPPQCRCPKWLWDVNKHHTGFELNLCIGGFFGLDAPFSVEGLVRTRDWGRGEAGWLQSCCSIHAHGTLTFPSSLGRARLQPSCKLHSPRSPLYGMKVTKTLSTCEVQSLKSVNPPQGTNTFDTFFGWPCRCYQLLSQHCH